MNTKLIPLFVLLLILLLPSSNISINRAVYKDNDRALYEDYLQGIYHDYERSREKGRLKYENPELASMRDYIMCMDPVSREIPSKTLLSTPP